MVTQQNLFIKKILTYNSTGEGKMLVFLMILSLPLNNMVLENEKVTVSNLTLTPVPVFFSHRDVKAFNSRTHLFREWGGWGWGWGGN